MAFPRAAELVAEGVFPTLIVLMHEGHRANPPGGSASSSNKPEQVGQRNRIGLSNKEHLNHLFTANRFTVN